MGTSHEPLPGFAFPNRHRGELVASIQGTPRRLRLTLNALAQLEMVYDNTDILQLLHQFAQDGLRIQDAMAVIRVGLAGAGELMEAPLAVGDIRGGARAAKALATELLELAFG